MTIHRTTVETQVTAAGLEARWRCLGCGDHDPHWHQGVNDTRTVGNAREAGAWHVLQAREADRLAHLAGVA